jgi:hypothetical protein
MHRFSLHCAGLLFLISPSGVAIVRASPVNTITVGAGSENDGGPTIPFATKSFSGSLEEWVVADTTNPFGAGDLDFIFQVTDISGSIKTVSTFNCCYGTEGETFFAGMTTGFGSGTEAPTSLFDGFDFNFGPGMTVGTSVDLIMQTDEDQTHSALFFITGANGKKVEFEGIGPLPEPRSVALLLGCLFAVALVVRRRFRVSQG